MLMKKRQIWQHWYRLVYTQCGDLVGKVDGGREPPSSAGPHRSTYPPLHRIMTGCMVLGLLLGELLLDTSFLAERWK